MANTTLVQARVDETLKDEVTNIYDYYGLDLPTAIRIFMKKTVAVNGLPFDLRDASNKKISGIILEARQRYRNEYTH